MISLVSRRVHNPLFRLTRAQTSYFSSTTSAMRPLTVDQLNPAILKVQYAVRGELAIKAEDLRVKLQSQNHDLPFSKVISSNIGNPQQKGLDQPPLTFTRQVSPLFMPTCRREWKTEHPSRSLHSWSTRRSRRSSRTSGRKT